MNFIEFITLLLGCIFMFAFTVCTIVFAVVYIKGKINGEDIDK